MAAEVYQVIAAVIAALVAVWVAIVNKREDPLGRAVRLSAVADKVADTTARLFLERSRDQLAIEWTLASQAPRFKGWGTLATLAYVTGGVSLVVWFVEMISDRTQLWPWAFYVPGIVIINIAQWFRLRQLRKRRAWIEQERQWQGLPSPVRESAKTMPGETERALLKHF